MRIAIIGAGFCGIAVVWHLLQLNPHLDIDVFDPAGIGGGASGISAGLLHPFAGAHAKLNWLGREGMESTRQLLAISEKELGQPVADYSGLLRLAISEEQAQSFAKCASLYSDVVWRDVQQCQEIAPGIAPFPGILIKSAIIVNTALYLRGLWQACQKYQVSLLQREIKSLEDLKDYDVVVVSAGAASKNLPELAHLPLTPVKGQVLLLEWPEGLPPLTITLNSQAYVVMNSDGKTCLAGATFERDFVNVEPELNAAVGDLMPKIGAMLPLLGGARVLECRAGIRASTPDHHPIIGSVGDNCWVITGMGSKGLLYHGLFAERISRQIVVED